MKKVSIKRMQSQACLSYAEREKARAKLNEEFAAATDKRDVGAGAEPRPYTKHATPEIS